jgi:hypothetical protein
MNGAILGYLIDIYEGMKTSIMILLIHFSRITPIHKRRLKINWHGYIISVQSINQLFEYDVLF